MGVTTVVDHLSSIQQHRSEPKARKVVNHLEPVHLRSFRDNGFKQEPEGRNIPLAVAQVVEKPALSLPGMHFEDIVERAACG